MLRRVKKLSGKEIRTHSVDTRKNPEGPKSDIRDLKTTNNDPEKGSISNQIILNTEEKEAIEQEK